MVRSTSIVDRELLVTWIFSSIASHPALTDLNTIPRSRMNEINAGIGELVTEEEDKHRHT